MSNSNVGDVAGPDSMPSGLMMGVLTATMAGMAITDMPPGGMTGVGSMAIGEMPAGPMMGVPSATMAGMPITEMPIGSMTGVGSMAIGEMPAGPMMGVPTATMAGMVITEMPIGDMTSAERYGAKKKGELPTMEITGEWHLTLSPASLMSGTRT